MNRWLKKITTLIASILGGTKFTWFVILFFVFQAVWIAFSFRFPMVYDERFHFGIIQAFSDKFYPVIHNQPHSLDIYRDLAHEASYLYHFLMSLPLRAAALFTDQQSIHVLSLRMINIAMVAGGIFAFIKLFQYIKIPRSYANTAMFIFSLLPIVPFLAAHINYDNALFLITPIFLYTAIRVVQDKALKWASLVAFLTMGLLGSLIKFPFLVIFFLSVVWIGAVLIFRYKNKLLKVATASLKSEIKTRKLAVLLVPFSIFLLLSAQIYITNIVHYGTPYPSCAKTLGLDRCMANSVIKRNVQLQETTHTRHVTNPTGYFQQWILLVSEGMGKTAGVTKTGNKWGETLPIFELIMFTGVFIGVGLILYTFRALKLSFESKFLLYILLGYATAIFIRNLFAYYKFHELIAVQSRYFLLVLPIFLILVIMAVAYITRKRGEIRAVALVAVLLLFTQGGSLTPHILRSDNSWYWDDEIIKSVNEHTRNILKPVVKE